MLWDFSAEQGGWSLGFWGWRDLTGENFYCNGMIAAILGEKVDLSNLRFAQVRRGHCEGGEIAFTRKPRTTTTLKRQCGAALLGLRF
jgi:hypothetical protein